MTQLGLIGYPLGHSLSPKIHTAALETCGLRGKYSLFSISPDNPKDPDLINLLTRVRNGEITGLNVTIPHKQNVIPLLDELTPTAKIIGAVNTIYCQDGKLIGENTDASGFLADLRQFLGSRNKELKAGMVHESVMCGRVICRLTLNRPSPPAPLPILGEGSRGPFYVKCCLEHGFSPSPEVGRGGQGVRAGIEHPQIFRHFSQQGEPSPKAALVLGAGGAARAIVYGLVNNGWNVIVAARRPEQAQSLIAQFSIPDSRLSSIGYPTALYSLLPTLSLVVNATPLGMSPNVDTSPWPADLPFPPDAAVYDLVYNPPETKFVQAARAAGLPAITGLGMLIEQAALAFEIWTGCAPSREALFDAVAIEY